MSHDQMWIILLVLTGSISTGRRGISTTGSAEDQRKDPCMTALSNNPELRQQFTFYAGQLITSTIDMDSLTQSIEAGKKHDRTFLLLF